jgi:PucR C-terminal helix-turn-helix domain
VHHRLRRIHELTGHDPRRFAELAELTAALRLLDLDRPDGPLHAQSQSRPGTGDASTSP